MTPRHIEAGARLGPALAALACVLSACGDGDDLQGNNPPAVAQVTVEAPATTLAVGDSVQLQAVTLDADGNPLEDRTVEWASASPDVAAVSGKRAGHVFEADRGLWRGCIGGWKATATTSIFVTVDRR